MNRGGEVRKSPDIPTPAPTIAVHHAALEPGARSPRKLYTSILCPYAHRVRIVLAEKGLAPEQVEVDPRNKPPELQALGAFGKVPVLEIQGRMISESAAICEFLDEIFQLPQLMPAEPLQRAQVRMWVRFADARLYPNTQHLLYAAPAAERPRYALALQEDLRHMDEYLSRHKGPYWLGEQFSHLDATFAARTLWSR